MSQQAKKMSFNVKQRTARQQTKLKRQEINGRTFFWAPPRTGMGVDYLAFGLSISELASFHEKGAISQFTFTKF